MNIVENEIYLSCYERIEIMHSDYSRKASETITLSMFPSCLNPFPERPFVVCERVRDDDTEERAPRSCNRKSRLPNMEVAVSQNRVHDDYVVFIRSVVLHGTTSPSV